MRRGSVLRGMGSLPMGGGCIPAGMDALHSGTGQNKRECMLCPSAAQLLTRPKRLEPAQLTQEEFSEHPPWRSRSKKSSANENGCAGDQIIRRTWSAHAQGRKYSEWDGLQVGSVLGLPSEDRFHSSGKMPAAVCWRMSRSFFTYTPA